MLGLIWIKTVRHSDGIPGIFRKKLLKKKSTDNKKHAKFLLINLRVISRMKAYSRVKYGAFWWHFPVNFKRYT